MNTNEAEPRRAWWKNEWVIMIAVFGVLYATGTLIHVQAALQRVVLATGLFRPELVESGARREVSTPLNLVDREGTPVSTADLAGEVVFINAWATWCPPCLAEMPAIDAVYREYGDRVHFLMVNLDDEAETGSAFMRDRGYSLPVHRPAGPIPAWLDVSLIPATVVLARSGEMAVEESGMSQYDSDSFRSALDALLAERG